MDCNLVSWQHAPRKPSLTLCRVRQVVWSRTRRVPVQKLPAAVFSFQTCRDRTRWTSLRLWSRCWKLDATTILIPPLLVPPTERYAMTNSSCCTTMRMYVVLSSSSIGHVIVYVSEEWSAVLRALPHNPPHCVDNRPRRNFRNARQRWPLLWSNANTMMLRTGGALWNDDLFQTESSLNENNKLSSNYRKDINTQTIRIRKSQSLLILITIYILVTITILSFKDFNGFETSVGPT